MSTNHRAGGLIPSSFYPHVEVSFGKTLNPNLLLMAPCIIAHWCVSVVKVLYHLSSPYINYYCPTNYKPVHIERVDIICTFHFIISGLLHQILVQCEHK